jgi:ADP-ribose pyrophosphatase YjhB (NUDIX family)
MSVANLARSFSRRIPDDDTLARAICDHCGHVAYENPKVVVGSVVLHEGKVLLCRRAIEPRSGYWTVPAGYMEMGETPEQGARREAMEEACATIELEGLLAIYTVKKLSQVQLIYRARLNADANLSGPLFAAGPESLDVQLFDWPDIPWDDIAFPTVRWMLTDVQKALTGALGAPFTNPAVEPEPDL